MATEKIDCLGLKCPQPILKVAAKIPTMQKGDIIEVLADCPSFPADMRAWCQKTGRVLLMLSTDAEGKHTAQIQL
jgi:tRNA 2-thiouridine synthesizing protein A